MAKYVPDAGCYDAAVKASGGRLSKEEIESAFQKIADHKERLKAEGHVGELESALRKYTQDQAERTRIQGAIQRRHAALNILVRDRLDDLLQSHMDSGLTPREALLAVFEGTTFGVKGGRVSVDATRGYYDQKFVFRLLGDLEKEVPEMRRMIRDKNFDNDVKREMWEIREGGNPGITKNPQAKAAAQIFHRHLEISRARLNELGASIGKIDGYSGPQVHDPFKLIGIGKDGWVAKIYDRLDLKRTFEDPKNVEANKNELGEIYDTIITGFSRNESAAEKGMRVSPANMANKLNKHRVLHFINADNAIAYNDEFGHGSTITGMLHHQQRMARFAANMEVLGPNPTVMLDSVVANLQRRVRNSTTYTDDQKTLFANQLKTDVGKIKQAADIASGYAARPDDLKWTKIGETIRGFTRMGKLGGALFSAFGGDQVTMAMASMFRGSGFFKGLFDSFSAFHLNRPAAEISEINYLTGEGLDGLVGHLTNPAAGEDTPMGFIGPLQEKFFRWNGLTGWTDRVRAVSGRVIASEMGMRQDVAWANLPARYRHTLEMNGFTESHWNVVRTLDSRQVNGKRYVTADLAETASDDAVEPLVRDRIAAARKASKVDEAKTEPTRLKREEDFQRRRAKLLDEARRETAMTIGRFINDESAFSVIELDARARRTTTMGYRPGTAGGEVIRFLMTFKGFPIAFMQRVGGRAWRGHGGRAASLGESISQHGWDRTQHIGSMLLGMTMAGYWSLMLKDLSRGNWPPRDPFDPKTLGAAFVQGGAMGIYGDFLFSKVNRFGSGPMETLAGPVFGAGGDFINILLEMRDYGIDETLGEGDGKFPAADMLNFVMGNTPFANLYYVRPALDLLFLDAARDWLSPGSIDRQLSKREEEYGQTNWIKELSR